MTPVVGEGQSQVRIPELDGLRGLAVAGVLMWHFLGCLLNPDLGSWTRIVYHITILGRTGVDLFFVLSGFLITSIILNRTQPINDFLCRFYWRRALRIFPSYVILVFIFWHLIAIGVNNSAFNNDIPWWRHLTFTQNLWMSSHEMWGPTAISITWSVAIEEQFYLIWPLILILAPYRQISVILVILAICSCAYRAINWIEWHRVFMPYVGTLCRLDGLVLGSLIACLYKDPMFEEKMAKKYHLLRFFFIGLLILFPIFFICISTNLPKTMFVWGHTYLSVFYGSCLLMILKWRNTRRTAWLRGNSLCQLGLISYTLYLFHPIFIDGIFTVFNRQASIASLGDSGLAALALMLSLLWSKLSLRFLEAPLTGYGRRWSY